MSLSRGNLNKSKLHGALQMFLNFQEGVGPKQPGVVVVVVVVLVLVVLVVLVAVAQSSYRLIKR